MYCCRMLTELKKTPVLLARHIKFNHSGLVAPHCPIIPPSAMFAGVRLPNREMTSVINMVGRTSQVLGPLNPVSSSGDGGAGRIGSLRSRPFSVWREWFRCWFLCDWGPCCRDCHFGEIEVHTYDRITSCFSLWIGGELSDSPTSSVWLMSTVLLDIKGFICLRWSNKSLVWSIFYTSSVKWGLSPGPAPLLLQC
jgi:hypothetical protein